MYGPGLRVLIALCGLKFFATFEGRAQILVRKVKAHGGDVGFKVGRDCVPTFTATNIQYGLARGERKMLKVNGFKGSLFLKALL